MKKEKIENWEKELLKLKISDWTSDNGIPVEIWNFIEEFLKSEREKLLEKIKLEKFEILEGNKYKKGKEEGFWVQTNYALGYNQAIADFISLSYRNFDSRNFYRNFNND